MVDETLKEKYIDRPSGTYESQDPSGKKEKKSSEGKQKNAYYGQMPTFENNGPSKIRRSFEQGISNFLVLAAAIAFYFILTRLPNLSSYVAKILDVLMPVLYGCVIAFVLNPIVVWIDRNLTPFLSQKNVKEENAKKIARSVGIVVSIVLLLALVIALFSILIPELYSSIRRLVLTFPSQMEVVMKRINTLTSRDATLNEMVNQAMEKGTDVLQSWLSSDLLGKTNEVMSNLTVGVFGVVSTLVDIIIGLIISIYLLYSKETFIRQAKKCVYAFLPPKQANLLLHFSMKTNEVFGGFVVSKIVDSAIIGVLCFLGMTFLNMPYIMLVSVIVGVTNIIPFFGPYIGAVPSTILILLVSPMKGLYFVIFILVLQQFDGNILGPKIMGNSTGLSAFWVIVAILLGGGLFGFPGMLLGVPTFAVIYYIVQVILQNMLEKKRLPVDSEYYDSMSYVDNKGIYRHSEVVEDKPLPEPEDIFVDHDEEDEDID